MTASLLDRLPIIGAVRRNHALEHATMQILAEKYKGVRMAGLSNPQGFLLIADLPTEIVTEAALEAEKRLKAGESQLAIHPHCGTNLAAPALAAGAAAWLALLASSGSKKPRLPHQHRLLPRRRHLLLKPSRPKPLRPLMLPSLLKPPRLPMPPLTAWS